MITEISPQTRQTKYRSSIIRALNKKNHASNAELLAELKKMYPELSPTTVHRLTSRLVRRGEIGVAPSAKDGSMRFDTNLAPHDHFICNSCDILRDTDVKDEITPILENSIGDCRISGRLTISGICKNCIKLDREKHL